MFALLPASNALNDWSAVAGADMRSDEHAGHLESYHGVCPGCTTRNKGYCTSLCVNGTAAADQEAVRRMARHINGKIGALK